MKRIWKVDCLIGGTVEVPGQVVSAGIAPHTPAAHVSIWFVHFNEDTRRPQTVQVIGTGQDYQGTWLATAVHPTLPLVWHVIGWNS